jgi:type VI secretion system secreted protein Hcp
VLLAAVLLASPRLGAADDIFVRIDGIEGDVQEVSHVGWIRAFAVGNSVSSSSSNTGVGGLPTVVTAFSDVSVLKGIDRASPALFVAAATGEQRRAVDVEFVRGGEDPFVYFRIQLTDVLITGVRTNASSRDQNITEFVTFAFERIRWEYRVQRPDGTPGGSVVGCWDMRAKIEC